MNRQDILRGGAINFSDSIKRFSITKIAPKLLYD